VPRRIQIRTKLAAALAVPLAGLVAVTGLAVRDADRAAAEAETETSLASAAIGPASLVSQLQNERNFTSVDLIGMGGSVSLPVASVAEARQATDQALAELRRFVADRGDEAQAAFAPGLAAVERGLVDVRSRVDGFAGERGIANSAMADEVFDAYASMLAALLDGTAGLAYAIDDAELRTGVELVDLTTRLYELRSVTIRDSVIAVLSGNTGPEAQLAVRAALAETDAMERTIEQRAVGPYAFFDHAALDDESVQHQERLMHGFASTGQLDIAALLGSVESNPDRGVLLLRRQASDRLLAQAEQVLGNADTDRRDAILLSGSLLIVAMALTALVSRSITRPLASLQRQAEAMAAERLPAAVQAVLDTPLGEDVTIPEVEPVSVETRDEVADVAAVLNVVQRSALDLAVEQAVLRRNIADSFVNLGRRNQNLLDRQLDFITELEREERDPDALASLFRLDHLATRMRRNAESLLRLAGSEPQRRWSAPIELGDVVRGALGEIEDFQRVQVRGVDAVAVPGGVGADLAHALAELLENALSFSPPSEPVEVRGRYGPEGYVLAIGDNGLGMTPEELAVANRRLAGEESFTVAPSRYLGHYVAGHLASRLGIRIELQPGPAGGLVARVEIPSSMLVEAPAAETAALDLVSAPAPAPLPPAPPMPAVAEAPWSAADFDPVPASSAVPAAPPAPAPWEPEPAAGPFASPSLNPFEVAGGNGHATPSGLEAVPGPMPAAGTTPVPEPVAGFGGLAPVPPAEEAAPAAAAADFGTTPSGLVRRVPGAQRPVTDLGGRSADAHAPEPTTTPDAVASFLSSFSAGVSRGIADAGRSPWEDEQ